MAMHTNDHAMHRAEAHAALQDAHGRGAPDEERTHRDHAAAHHATAHRMADLADQRAQQAEDVRALDPSLADELMAQSQFLCGQAEIEHEAGSARTLACQVFCTQPEPVETAEQAAAEESAVGVETAEQAAEQAEAPAEAPAVTRARR